MAVINVYEQYFEAEACFDGVARHAALVMLTADSEQGNICYKAAVSFFPHNDPEDFAVSYDAYFEDTLYEARGRRSKKREKALLDRLQDRIGQLAVDNGAMVYFDRPLREARFA